MCLISSAVSEWALPIIYHSLRFTTAQAITDFVAQHDKTSERIYTRLLLVRDLYIGKIPDESSDLSYGSLHWPITSLQRLISSCAELRSLTVLGLDQRLWARFQPLLPPRLTKVTLGPIHGAHNSKNLKQHPPISFLTSAHTYLSDGEVEDVMMYPTMTRFRKMCEANSMAPLWAVNQAPIIKRSKQMKEYEIVICGAPEYAEPAYVLATQRKEELELDSRVVLRQYHGETWIAMVFQEFLDCRQCFLGTLLSSLPTVPSRIPSEHHLASQ
ncbi:hypothetical protein P691DRAFT_712762 [Macrolepiota fuliginosa MF-IS2]|uniref:Uncharacterized protein n=1 Tax=Macrolepiota fuliginosa MF-IS2 TaxID=1400762 RepID=A0A9P5X5L7_9AGAR|nr:hypothetical protein P691DRAFT_712762 [Macrolepiota fuliginosa MF-IS2]